MRQLPSIHMATTHLSSPIGESSKMVPTLTEDCFRQSLHCHRLRFRMKVTAADPQPIRGHTARSGQRIFATKSWAMSGVK